MFIFKISLMTMWLAYDEQGISPPQKWGTMNEEIKVRVHTELSKVIFKA